MSIFNGFFAASSEAVYNLWESNESDWPGRFSKNHLSQAPLAPIIWFPWFLSCGFCVWSSSCSARPFLWKAHQVSGFHFFLRQCWGMRQAGIQSTQVWAALGREAYHSWVLTLVTCFLEAAPPFCPQSYLCWKAILHGIPVLFGLSVQGCLKSKWLWKLEIIKSGNVPLPRHISG